MEILVESTISPNECFFELYCEREMVGQMRVVRNANFDFEYETECSEPWAEAYLLEHLYMLPPS